MKERIFLICPDSNATVGGVKQIYRHADVLNKLGFEAYVLHRRKNFRVTWFANNTSVTSWSQIKLQDSDIMVLPEIFGPNMSRTLAVEKKHTLISPSRYWVE